MLRSQPNINFKLPNSSDSKKGVPKVEEVVQAPAGSTEDVDEWIEPQCHGDKEVTSADVGCEALENDGADQASSSNSSKSVDEVSGLESLVLKIIRKGKRSVGEKGT